jgi:hypothetical protein
MQNTRLKCRCSERRLIGPRLYALQIPAKAPSHSPLEVPLLAVFICYFVTVWLDVQEASEKVLLM